VPGALGQQSKFTRRTTVGGVVAALVTPLTTELANASSVSTTGSPPTSLSWLPMGGEPKESEVFDMIESDPQWSLDFIIYLARILLNYDKGSSDWWSKEVIPLIPADADPGVRGASLREKFAEFSASVEFSLRQQGRTALLQKLVKKFGQSEEGRRHLAIAFTLLNNQPLDMISSLLASLKPEARLKAVFSPALSDYLAMDPKRLLPYTQYPVWDGSARRWVVPGLQAAQPYKSPLDGYEAASVFGPRADSLVFKERTLKLEDYGLFALSGALGCALTHSAVIPLDVVKTRQQTDPQRFTGNLISGAIQIKDTEGWAALSLGWEPTVLGYLWYGVTVYPGYEFFKRFFFTIAGPLIVESFRVPLVLLAAAAATAIACIGVCPAEACRIRMVADDAFQGQRLLQVVGSIAKQDGIGYFYDGLSTILVRQILFGMMKFLVFDYFSDFVLDIFPVLAQSVETQLAVSLFSGAVAGVTSSIVSQPADTVLSRMNQGGGRSSFLEAGGEVYQEDGLPGFFRGLGSRCVWAGCIISGQFFLYDLCKNLLGVKDLRMFLDVQV